MKQIIFLGCLALTACSIDVRDKEEPAPPQQVFDFDGAAKQLGIAGPHPLSGPYHRISVGAKANEYTTELHLPEVVGRVDRVDLESGETSQLFSQQTTFVDQTAEPGKSYEYQFSSTNGQSVSFRVKIPIDLAVIGQTVLTANGGSTFRFRRVFISSQGSIISNGQPLDLYAEELISEAGGRIGTFAENSRAADGMPGRNGGAMKISILLARGDLRIDVSGENGGKGIDGAPYEQRAQSGHDFPFDDNNNGRPCLNAYEGLGPSGVDGVTGRPAGNAAPGGDSGSLDFKIGGKEQLHVSIFKTAGTGAPGGLGGPGQLGGLGGLSKRMRHMNGEICPMMTPERGPEGKNGPKGADGQPSGPGHDTGKICVTDFSGSSCR